jgi:hypothetical protein
VRFDTGSAGTGLIKTHAAGAAEALSFEQLRSGELMGRTRHAFLILAIALVTSMGTTGCRKDYSKLSQSDLLARLESATPDAQTEIAIALSRQGDAAIPSILEAFTKTNKIEIRAALAESVYRMRPSDKTRAALEQMHKMTEKTDLGERIENFLKEHRGGG